MADSVKAFPKRENHGKWACIFKSFMARCINSMKNLKTSYFASPESGGWDRYYEKFKKKYFLISNQNAKISFKQKI